MKSLFRWSCALLALSLLAGCVTRARARADAQAAFLAGQQHAMQQAQQPQQAGPNVTVVGPVKYTLVPWNEEMTVARAIIAAQYIGPGEPREISILRNGQSIPVDLKRLLSGEDQPLQSGDVLQLKP